MEKNIRIGDVLVSCGYITEDHVKAAMEVQKNNKSKRLGEIMIDLGFITEDQLLQALSRRLKIALISLNEVAIDGQVVGLIPREICRRYQMMAIDKKDGYIIVVLNDPLDFYGIEDVKSFLNQPCRFVLAPKQEILDAIRKHYAEIEAKSAVAVANEKLGEQSAVGQVDLEAEESEEPVIRLINTILLKGYSDGASDIHFEPFETQMSVRLRIDGQLVDYTQVEPKVVPYVATRIKILAEMDIAERRIPQDGNFKVKMGGQEIGIRVSTIPTAFGEKIVLRFLSKGGKLDHADQYGMNAENYKKIERILRNPYGIVYITGPTGSGKTTTLYMMMERMSQQPINICTIEDPIERHLKRVNQVQVNQQAGLTFDSGLRAMLRQDPDVILVGETRDNETASIAVTSAITGHLVLSTLHTNDAISSIVRLQDMGIEGYLLANALIGLVAQRLVKKICPHCKSVYQPTVEEQKGLEDIAVFYKGEGCHQCNYSGYKGRIAVHEVLEIDPVIRAMITSKEPTEHIYRYVREQDKLVFMKDDIKDLVKGGTTTVDEYLRHTAFMI